MRVCVFSRERELGEELSDRKSVRRKTEAQVVRKRAKENVWAGVSKTRTCAVWRRRLSQLCAKWHNVILYKQNAAVNDIFICHVCTFQALQALWWVLDIKKERKKSVNLLQVTSDWDYVFTLVCLLVGWRTAEKQLNGSGKRDTSCVWRMRPPHPPPRTLFLFILHHLTLLNLWLSLVNANGLELHAKSKIMHWLMPNDWKLWHVLRTPFGEADMCRLAQSLNQMAVGDVAMKTPNESSSWENKKKKLDIVSKVCYRRRNKKKGIYFYHWINIAFYKSVFISDWYVKNFLWGTSPLIPRKRFPLSKK